MYIYIYMYIYTHVFIHLSMNRERERGREYACLSLPPPCPCRPPSACIPAQKLAVGSVPSQVCHGGSQFQHAQPGVIRLSKTCLNKC